MGLQPSSSFYLILAGLTLVLWMSRVRPRDQWLLKMGTRAIVKLLLETSKVDAKLSDNAGQRLLKRARVLGIRRWLSKYLKD